MSEVITSKIAEAAIEKHYTDFKGVVDALNSPRFDNWSSVQRMHDLDHKWRKTGDRSANRQADIIEKNLARDAEAKEALLAEKAAILGAAAVHKDEYFQEYIQIAEQDMRAADNS